MSLFLEEKGCRNESDDAAKWPFLPPPPFNSDILQDEGYI